MALTYIAESAAREPGEPCMASFSLLPSPTLLSFCRLFAGGLCLHCSPGLLGMHSITQTDLNSGLSLGL